MNFAPWLIGLGILGIAMFMAQPTPAGAAPGPRGGYEPDPWAPDPYEPEPWAPDPWEPEPWDPDFPPYKPYVPPLPRAVPFDDWYYI